LLLIVLVAFTGCERVEYYPDRPISFEKTFVIAHKGGGNFDAGNTFPACQYGLSKADGIEIDLQKTSDNIVWLSHSSYTQSCGGFAERCFPSSIASAIADVNECLGSSAAYASLESVLAYASENYPQKYISLDVKAWKPCGLSNLNVIYEMNQMGDAIVTLVEKYGLEDRVMIESEVGDFLYHIKKRNPRIGTYLVTLGDFELGVSRALDAGFTGISFEFSGGGTMKKELISLIRRKGLKIQLWTVNGSADFEEAMMLEPDFIQTDDI
jgi:glycerophosphoryl diester phosphodiesterase